MHSTLRDATTPYTNRYDAIMLDQETWDSISGNNLVYELEWVAADRDNNLALFVSYMPAKVP
ncbi:MAG: hypothetical protein MI810_03425, partial [Flavobacteriales bacterium]|nr:hypothetical protein [Flavobacteriales bacterium]